MNFSEDILQHIEDYLNGTMTAEQIAAFENQIKENSDLAETIEINKKMRLQYGDTNWDFIKDNKYNKKINDLESLLKSSEFQEKKKAIESASDSYFKKEKKSNNNKPKLYYVLAIAAAFIIFLGIFLKNNTLSNQEIYSQNSDWSELPSLVSRSDTNTILLSTGENAFLNKDYKLASESFSTYINSETQANPTVLLYIGISQLELKNYTLALDNFQKIIESNAMDKSKGYWYKALTYLKMNDKNNAIKQFKIIVSDTSNYNYNKAQAILENL